MKTLFEILILNLVLFCFSGCKTQEGYRLTGQLNGFAEGSKISLTLAATHRDEKKEAETILKKGHFTLTGQLTEPRLYLLTIEEPSGACGYYTLMLENSPITIEANKGQLMGDKYITVEAVKVEGSAADKTFHEKIAFKDKLNQMYEDYHAKHKEIGDKISAARASRDNETLKVLMQSEAYKAFEKDEHDFFTTVNQVMTNAVKENGDSFWGPLLLLYNANYFIPNDTAQMKVFEGFSENVKNSFYGQALKKQIYVETLKDKPLPTFILPDRNENELTDTKLREGKKCILIDFWASWCGPCRKSIPTLKEIYKDFSNRGLEIISISIDKKNADWQKALDEEKLPWPCLLDTKNVFTEKFDGRAVPTFFLVDKNGTVIQDNLEVKALRSNIEKIL